MRTSLVVVVAALAAGVAALAASPATPSASGATATARPASPIPAVGGRWFAVGANLPWVRRGCDFGCGRRSGVRRTRAAVDRMFRDMSRRGVRVVRWELFPNSAWQVTRRADGTPVRVSAAALFDLDVAVGLAAKHDVFLLPAVLPDPDRVPTTWFTDPAQATALGTALRPMFARYARNRHVLGWELVTGAEMLADTGVASPDQLRTHGAALLSAQQAAAPARLAVIGPGDVSRIDTWTGLGADLYTPHDASSMAGEADARARSAAAVRTAEGADAPIVIGGFDAATNAVGSRALGAYVRLGYAGALAWSWRGVEHMRRPELPARMPHAATWRLHYAFPTTGPRSRPLNPCYGPSARSYRCPNLKMAKPTSVSLGRSGRRTILYSTNSLDSRGAGPASLHGTRNGRFTMAAKQVLHRVDGRKVLVDTEAKLLFKAIPGQYRYWKWNGAAQMELWRLDSTGRPIERTRVGPKTVYCLRDLQRRAGWLPRSPRGYVYPGCSQRLSQQRVTLGTSVGWSDVYPASYHENWIDVSGLRGCFAYVHIADPTNVIYESNEDDNASSVVVKLPWRGSNAGCPGARPIPTTGSNGIY